MGHATNIHVCLDSGRALRKIVQLEVLDSKYYFRPLESMPKQKTSQGTSAVIEFKGPYAKAGVRSPSETEAAPPSPPAPSPLECCPGRGPGQHPPAVAGLRRNRRKSLTALPDSLSTECGIRNAGRISRPGRKNERQLNPAQRIAFSMIGINLVAGARHFSRV